MDPNPPTPTPAPPPPPPPPPPRRRRQQLTLFLQVAVWWGANNAFAVDAHRLLAAHPAHVFVDLTFTQLFLGLVLSALYHAHARPSTASRSLRAAARPRSAPALLAALLHLCGSALTNASYRAIGAASTLVWKLSEPVATVGLKRVVLREATPPLSLLGVACVLAGVLIFSARSLTALSVSPIVLANLAFPSRNVLLKLDQRRDTSPASPSSPTSSGAAGAARPTELRFFALHAAAIPFATVALLVKLIFTGPSLALAPVMIRNALLFNAYQFASIAILEKLDALTHSLANTMKRFTGILLSFVVLQEAVEPRHALGLLCTVIGFPMYVFGGKKFTAPASSSDVHHTPRKGSNSSNKRLYLLLAVAGALLAALAASLTHAGHVSGMVDSLINSQVSSVGGRGARAGSGVNAGADSHSGGGSAVMPKHLPPQSARKYLVFVPDRFELYTKVQPVSRIFKNYEEATDPAGNMGNKVWRHGAYLSLPDFSETKTCNGSKARCVDMLNPSGDHSRLVEYHPCANYFNRQRKADFVYDLRALKNPRMDILYVGIGIQAYFTRDMSNNDLNPGMRIEFSPKDFRFTPGARQLLRVMQQRKLPMLFRGDFTLQATREAGYTYGISNGCPSLMISTDVHLGKTLQKRYDALNLRVGDKSLKVAINMKNTARYTQFYKRLLEMYPNSFIFAQGSGDIAALQAQGVPYSRVKFFEGVEEWRAALREMDVSIGARIHGNMIALSVGLPVYVIAPDHRVLELVQRMRLPHVTWYDDGLSTDPGDVAERIGGSGFDGKAFDENRCRIAQTYVSVFGQYGIHVSKHVRDISRIC